MLQYSKKKMTFHYFFVKNENIFYVLWKIISFYLLLLHYLQ